jgi:hypothetical protein
MDRTPHSGETPMTSNRRPLLSNGGRMIIIACTMVIDLLAVSAGAIAIAFGQPADSVGASMIHLLLLLAATLSLFSYILWITRRCEG